MALICHHGFDCTTKSCPQCFEERMSEIKIVSEPDLLTAFIEKHSAWIESGGCDHLLGHGMPVDGLFDSMLSAAADLKRVRDNLLV